MSSKRSSITKLIPRDVLDANELALRQFDFYKRVYDIVERTHIAMGRRMSYTSASASTMTGTINLHAIASTY